MAGGWCRVVVAGSWAVPGIHVVALRLATLVQLDRPPMPALSWRRLCWLSDAALLALDVVLP